MRILSVVPVMGVGGAEVVTATLTLDAHRRGHQVTLASAGGFRAEALGSAGVRLLDIATDGRRPRDLLSAMCTLRRFAHQDRPDVIHAHNVKAALVARGAVGAKASLVTTVHGVAASELRAAGRILRWSSDRVIAVSPYVADQLISSGVPEARVEVIENTVTPLPTHSRAAARARLGLDTDSGAAPLVVLCAARMTNQKRHDLLIEAWAEIPTGLLLLAGDGPNRVGIERRVEELGLSHRVRLLGERTDVDWLLAASDVLVLPTDWEGLPISLLEAMAAGVPAVVSRVGGVIETLGSGVALVEPGSAAALRNGLVRVMGSRTERAELAVQAQELVAARFGADRMLDAYAALYDRVTQSRSSA